MPYGVAACASLLTTKDLQCSKSRSSIREHSREPQWKTTGIPEGNRSGPTTNCQPNQPKPVMQQFFTTRRKTRSKAHPRILDNPLLQNTYRARNTRPSKKTAGEPRRWRRLIGPIRRTVQCFFEHISKICKPSTFGVFPHSLVNSLRSASAMLLVTTSSS